MTWPTLAEAQAAVDAAATRATEDVNRPIFHAMCPGNWMNDPNGPILVNGEVHVFYQHNPLAPTGGNMYWGHMKSKDLVHWTHLPIAFGPSWDKGEDGCWSGSCIAGPGGLPHAIYTSVGPKKRPTDTSEQWIAVGSGDLSRWEKHPSNPVMTHALHGVMRIEDWRDPYAWRAGETYYCVTGGHLVQASKPRHNPSAFLYKSLDMVHWTFLGLMCSRFKDGADASVEPGVNLGTNWECPLFFPLGDKHVLAVSVNGTAYTIGTFEAEKFVAPGSWHALDHSGAFYAPHTLADGKGRRIVIGWIITGQHPAWSGCFSLPRVVTDRRDGTLGIEPIPELDSLHGEHVHVDRVEVPPGTACPLIEGNSFAAVTGDRAIECRFAIPLVGQDRGVLVPPEFELHLYDAIEGKHGFACCIGYDPEDSLIFIGNRSGAFHAEAGEVVLDTRLFIDRGVVELFINGRWAISNEIPIDTTAKIALVGRAVGSTPVIVNGIDCWSMSSIWGWTR